MKTEDKLPYLVQSVYQRENKGEGVDSIAGFEYMGSAEFEFGALPSALRRMCGTKDELVIRKIKDGEHTAWFLGTERFYENAKRWFSLELKGEARHKEMPYLRETYTGKYSWGMDFPERYRKDAWWALDMLVPWLLTRKKGYAELWRRKIREGKK